MTIGERRQRLRKQKRLSQHELSCMAVVRRATISELSKVASNKA